MNRLEIVVRLTAAVLSRRGASARDVEIALPEFFDVADAIIEYEREYEREHPIEGKENE